MTTPSNAALQARELVHTSGVYPIRDIAIVRGEGAHLFDADGRRYLDCATGQGVATLGHAHPRVVEAVTRQVGTLVTCSGSFPNDRRAEAQERLAAHLPASLDRLFFCNSGTEAMEGALKIARIATGRTGVVAAERGFHGRTMGALSCTWDPKYRAPFEPLVPGVVHAPHGDLAAFEARIGGDTAAVVVEVVQGEGGVRPTNAAFLQGLRRLCTERGALLVIDEVQTGFGRTGRVFAFEHFGIEPDLLALGKAIGGGLPMGAVAFGSAVGELPVGSHGSTFGGNPLACAAAVAALDVLEQERLPERAEALGARFRSRLGAIASPRVREVRGLGLMVAVELDVPSAPYLAALLERGVIALAAGPTVVRFLPPLVVAEEDLEFAADALEEVLALVPDPAAPSTARS